MKTHVYQLDCLTNLHVGDGEAGYNIIDNQVQRDVVLGVPTMHSSGVKGSFKSYVNQKGKEETLINKLFGDQNGKGELKFFSGNLISRPLRISDGEGGYVNATCPMIIRAEWEFLNAMNVENLEELKLPEVSSNQIIGSKSLGEGICVEEMKVTPVDNSEFPILEKWVGERWVLLNDDDFKSFDLPVQARNRLENGISQALWYEEVVPYKSRFHIAISEEVGNGGLETLNGLIEGQVVQFGANASIGYGYCKVTVMK